jgi:SsrA-binding protein
MKGDVRMAKQKGIKPIAANRRARHDYFVEETYECGLALHGTEGKSIRQGHVNLKESYAHVKNGEMFVESMHISPYEQGNIFNTDPMRPKKLLMHKAEIRKLGQLVQRKGYTLIPLQLYLKDGRVKLELGVCVGKHLHDKRASAAERDAKLEAARAVREQRAE